jgi:hypothetical protein
MAIRNFNERTLTAEVLKRVGRAPEARTRKVMQSLVKHLHAFVREVRPTQAEWFQGIQFLTATGHMCDDKRQEFILMSDTLGVSMLVDFINYGKAGKATESTVLGPFFVEGAPEMPLGANIARPGTPGELSRRRARQVPLPLREAFELPGAARRPRGQDAGGHRPPPHAARAPALHVPGAGLREAGDAPVRQGRQVPGLGCGVRREGVPHRQLQEECGG